MVDRLPQAAVLTGIGAWLPPDVLTNADLAARLGITDEWIRSRTGIVSRHRVSPNMSTSDLAVEAGRRALESSGRDQVDAVVLATTTPDELGPATAPQVAYRLGQGKVPAFDISAACSGFLYGLAAAAGLIATAVADRVLLIGAEAFTTLVDGDDRDTAPLFGDGAGAIVLRAGDWDEPGAVGRIVLGTDGAGNDLARVPGGGARCRVPNAEAPPHLRMRGNEVFRHAVRYMTAACRTASKAAGWRVEDVDRLIAHQANARIVAAVADNLGVPLDRRATNIEKVGNTSAASVPLLLAEENADRRLVPGDRVLLTAFGGGFTWGATTLVWPSLVSIP